MWELGEIRSGSDETFNFLEYEIQFPARLCPNSFLFWQTSKRSMKTQRNLGVQEHKLFPSFTNTGQAFTSVEKAAS